MGSGWSRRRALPSDGTDDQHSRVLADNLTHGKFCFLSLALPYNGLSADHSAIPDTSHPDTQRGDDVRDTGAGERDGTSASITAISDPLTGHTPDARLNPADIRTISQHETSLFTGDQEHELQAEGPITSSTSDRPVRDQQLLERVMSSGSRRGKLFLLVTITCSLFAAFRLLPQRKSTDPPVFFSSSSGILDFRYGEMTKLSLRVLEHEVAFVLYYAHWDLDSMRYKSEHESIAKVFSEEIFFAAINCWWPDGECSKVMRLKRFPVLLAHVRSVGDVEYRGPLVPSYIIPFLDSLLDPVIPIHSPGDLLDLRSRHDAVIVRFFDFRESGQPHGYNNYLSLAVKALATDPWRRVQFTIVTSRKSAYKLRVTRPASLYMFMWNSSLEVSVDDDRNQNDDLLTWIQNTLREKGSLVDWVTPTGVKSNLLNAVMSQDPTLILFTPRTSLFGISPYFEIVSRKSYALIC